MAGKRIVIGGGPDALRAAAVLATAGHAVTLLQGASSPSGRERPTLPEGTGRLRVRPEARALTEQVLGPLAAYPDVARGVALRGTVRKLPLGPYEIPAMLAGAAVAPAAASWVRARTRNALLQLTGGGTEERSYRDWVVRRMGLPAYDGLYRSYGERRWGLPGTELSVSAARVFHGQADVGDTSMVAGGEASAIEHASALIRQAGGEILTGVQIKRIRLNNGRVQAVEGSMGELEVEGPLWVARPPCVVVGWLGDQVDSGAHVDGQLLTCRAALQVSMRGETQNLPHELHVLDDGAPFYRVVRPVGTDGLAVFHASMADGAELPTPRLIADRFIASATQLGLGAFDRDSIEVELLPEHMPLWGRVCHSRLRRTLLRYREWGVVGVGRRGAFAFLDPAEEIGLAAQYRDEESPDQREVHRALVDPPVLVDDLGAHITRFVER